MTTPQVFPLAWPAGRFRRGGNKPGQFRCKNNSGFSAPVTISVAVQRLQDETWKLGGRNLLISSNLRVGKNGLPLSGQTNPGDPGVCAYFSIGETPIAIACDTYIDAAQNIAALAAHIEATRSIERHGVATAAETLRAFEALPPPKETTWRDVLDIVGECSADFVNRKYRDLAKRAQGDEDEIKRLNIARDEALKDIT